MEIIIRDFSGAKIESHKFRINDKEKGSRILRALLKKYGFEISKRDKDISWLD